MGDRSNIVLDMQGIGGTSGAKLWLYSHWGGEQFTTTTLATALEAARGRWDDETYFNRIVIQSVFADIADSETGGGVGLYPSDNEHDVVQVIRWNERVAVYPDEHLGAPIATYSFEEYIAKYGGN